MIKTKQKKKKRERRETERRADFSADFSSEVSQPGVECLGDIVWKKKRLARDGKREWLIGTLERLWARNNVPQINKPLTSQTGSLKCCVWKSFSHLFIFKIRRASLSSAWKACVSGMCIMADSLPPYAPSTYSILSCFCALIEALLLLLLLLLSKRRYAKTTHSLFFPFRFLLCGANLTPVLHQVCISLIPLSFNPPLHIYTPAARNEWFTWRGSLPPSEKKSFATIHYSPASISLISLCCVTLEKPLRSSYLVFFLFFCFLFFSSTLSLLLFLWVFFKQKPAFAIAVGYFRSDVFMLFNVVERARGLRMGEKRSSWHTYAPVVNSSSQHSSKYTDLLLFPLPPSLILFRSLFLSTTGSSSEHQHPALLHSKDHLMED